MKLALSVISAVAMVGLSQAQTVVTPGLSSIYNLICASNTQQDQYGNVLFIDDSPFQFLTGYALGAQTQQFNTNSTCFLQSNATKTFLDTLALDLLTIYNGFSIFNLNTYSQTLFTDLSNLVIQNSNLAVACEDSKFISQFQTRVSTASGFGNLIFTIGYGFGYNMLTTILTSYSITVLPNIGNQVMYTAIMNIYNYIEAYVVSGTLPNCQQIGYNSGVVVAQTLGATIDSQVAALLVSGTSTTTAS